MNIITLIDVGEIIAILTFLANAVSPVRSIVMRNATDNVPALAHERGFRGGV